MTRSPWATLGIEATENERDIRKAYAGRLKDTHPEDDPEGFKELRAAYEAALRFAKYQAYAAQRALSDGGDAGATPQARAADQAGAEPLRVSSGEVGRDDATGGSAEPASAPPEVVAQHGKPEPTQFGAGPSQTAEHDSLQDHGRALGRLGAMLQGAVRASPDEVRSALDAVLSSDAMQQVQIRANIESWLGGALAYNVPRSDPAIVQAVEAFGWERLENRWDLPGEISFLLERARDLKLLAQLSSPRHKFHKGYELLQAAPSQSNLWRRLLQERYRGQAHEVLTRIRQQRPSLASFLNAEAVATWSKPSKLRPVYLGLMILAALTVAVFLFQTASSNRQGVAQIDTRDYQAEADRLANLTYKEPYVPDHWLKYCQVAAYHDVVAETASDACNNAVRATYSSPEALHARAFLHLRNEEFSDASWDYNQLVAANPHDAKAQYGRGLAYYEVNRKARATPDIGRALQMEPHVARAFAALPLPVLSVKPGYKPPPLQPVVSPPVLGRAPVWPSARRLRPPVMQTRPLIWATPPNGADVQRFYPPAALQKRLAGAVRVSCSLLPAGRLHCAAVAESPSGMGFGVAALKVMRPVTVTIGYGPGQARPSSTVSATIHFAPPRPIVSASTTSGVPPTASTMALTPPRNIPPASGVFDPKDGASRAGGPLYDLTPSDTADRDAGPGI